MSKHASIACRQRTNFVGRRGWKKGRTITKEIQIKERTKEIEDVITFLSIIVTLLLSSHPTIVPFTDLSELVGPSLSLESRTDHLGYF